jgi:hypothetical protein
MERETLYLVSSGGIWAADYSKTSERQKMINLFETAIIPTPFTTAIPAESVMARIAKLNPQYEVKVGR